MKILGIETSCDETAAAVVENGTHILSNLVSSQVDIHARYGGIVPEVASRQHILSIVPIVRGAMAEACVGWKDIDGVAVTAGPGLAGSLLVGVNTAKAIAWAQNLSLIGINHIEGHIYANWLDESGRLPTLPAICLIVSGGHSDLALMREHGGYILMGRTRDDAAGEAFDKVARILELGYPGGPIIEEVARKGDASACRLPRAWLGESCDFSFSGLKTAVLRLMEAGKVSAEGDGISTADMAAGFQEAVVDVLVAKTIRAAEKSGARQILLAGGVASNKLLRRTLNQRSLIPVHFPDTTLCTDNAAMIASCGYFCLRSGRLSHWNLDAVPGLKL